MSNQIVYSKNNTELLLTKIDSLIQKSRETRNRVANKSHQKGGNLDADEFVTLTTPVNYRTNRQNNRQRGGNVNNLDFDDFVNLSTPVNRQQGGNIDLDDFVNLSTPVNRQQGGNIDLDDFVTLSTPVNRQSGGKSQRKQKGRKQKGRKQKGGNADNNADMDEFVDLDTPVPQNGGNNDGNNDGVESIDLTEPEFVKPAPAEKFTGIDQMSDISKLDFGFAQADAALARFDMLGGGCGCGDDRLVVEGSGGCGSLSYEPSSVSSSQKGGSANIVADLNKALGSVDGLLRGF